MYWRTILLTVTVVLFAGVLSAQSSLTNDDVVKLMKAGMSEEFVVGLIRQQPAQFATDANRLVELKEAGLSERVIGEMTAKTKPQEPLTTDGVVKLVKGGFSEDFVLKTIKTQDASFATDVNRVVQLKQAGVSEKVIAAMMSKSGSAQRAAVEIPAGTDIVIRLIDSIDSEKNKEGDSFKASLEEALVVNGETAAPRGADATVKLVGEKESGKLTGKAELTVALAGITVGGRTVAVNSSSVSQESGSQGQRTAKVAGGGAVLGAIIGGIAGGGRGAAIGAGAGAAAGAGSQVFMKGQVVRIPSETILRFRTENPIQIQK